MNKKVLSVLVDNTSGVLNRVAGLFSRKSEVFKNDNSGYR